MAVSAVCNHIAGRKEAASPAEGSTYDVVHPATGRHVHAVHASTPDELQSAIEACAAAGPRWADTPLSERKAVFLRAADILDDASSGFRDRLIQTNIDETAITPFWAGAQVEHMAESIRTLVGFADEALADWTVSVHGGHATTTISRQPYGVCLAIPAWNASHALTSRAIFTPLLAGNTVLLKTSEITPATQLVYADLLYAAGLPAGALNVVHVAPRDMPEAMPQVIAHPLVRHVNFTGSTRVGSILAGLAGRHLKPTIMELGGKAPVLVLDDANMAAAANNILFGAFHNAGQICMSTERILVPASSYDALCTALRAAWTGFSAAAHLHVYSPVSSGRIREMVAQAEGKGARDVLRPDEADGQDKSPLNGIRPVILGPVDSSMALYREESFGPLAVIIRVEDASRSPDEVLDEMVRIANDSEYGLSAGVWSRDIVKARKVAARLECGAVHINSPTPADPQNVPHGGWKSSGWGRFNGVEGLRAFTQTRSIEYSEHSDGQMLPLGMMGLGREGQ